MPSVPDLLGPRLIGPGDSEVDTESLVADDAIVGLYFSADWCPPCRGFTPKLCQFYDKYKQGDSARNLSIVFVSSDRDGGTFADYFKEMPWLALPFEERDRKARLSKKFKVQGIPALVFLEGKTGKLITQDGRNNLLDDPEGVNFPWYPKPLAEILKGPVHCHTGDLTYEQTLQGKVKGLYFSAHWCPPCRLFTPILEDCYKKLRQEGKNFEVVYLSSDRSEESYDDYFSTMPWLAFPFGDDRISEITKVLGVQGIPTLILLDENEEIISTNGRAVITKDPEGKEFPWPPRPLNELSEITAPFLNQSACLIYFTDGEEDQILKAKDVLQDIAHKYCEEQKASRNTDNELPELYFLYEGVEGDEIADSLRSFADLDDHVPLVAILDVPEQQAYALPDTEITQDMVQSMVNDFKAYRISYKPVRPPPPE